MSLNTVTSLMKKNPVALSGAVTLSYILLYTGYDKSKKSLNPSLILDFFLVRKGWDWTLVEANKAISLSGLTTLLLSFLPQFKEHSRELLWISANMLWTHSIYSFYKFYQFSLTKVFNDKQMKQLSIVLGSFGQLAIALGVFGKITREVLVMAATTLGIAHFWTMEVDYKYKLQVRPFAYLPFPLSGWVIFENFFNGKK